MTDVAGMHDDELPGEPVLEGPVVLLRPRLEQRHVDPVRDHAYPLGRCALRLEPHPHRLADRDDPVRTPEIEGHRPAQRADHERVSQPPERARDLREDVLADDDQRRAMPAGQEDGRRPQHRRVGHAEDDVGVAGLESAEDRGAHERQVVQGPARNAGPVERGRRDPLDRDTVSDDPPGALLVLLDRARDHMDVVVGAERLAELGQQVRRCLRPRPVVLVEDQKPGPVSTRGFGHRPRLDERFDGVAVHRARPVAANFQPACESCSPLPATGPRPPSGDRCRRRSNWRAASQCGVTRSRW